MNVVSLLPSQSVASGSAQGQELHRAHLLEWPPSEEPLTQAHAGWYGGHSPRARRDVKGRHASEASAETADRIRNVPTRHRSSEYAGKERQRQTETKSYIWMHESIYAVLLYQKRVLLPYYYATTMLHYGMFLCRKTFLI